MGAKGASGTGVQDQGGLVEKQDLENTAKTGVRGE